MDSEELVQLMKQLEEKNIDRETIEEKTKVSYPLLQLYANSDPVPVTIINNMKQLLEQSDADNT